MDMLTRMALVDMFPPNRKTVDMFLGEICVQAQGMSINLISSCGVETVVLLTHN